jgi:hypothetical protein
MWRVVVCDQETSWYEEAIARAGLQSQRNNNIPTEIIIVYYFDYNFISVPHTNSQYITGNIATQLLHFFCISLTQKLRFIASHMTLNLMCTKGNLF